MRNLGKFLGRLNLTFTDELVSSEVKVGIAGSEDINWPVGQLVGL